MDRTALVIVDLQIDFCPGGALPVLGGDLIVPVVNQLLGRFSKSDSPIFATRDWHPANHISFVPQGGIWPPHCVQETEGARFHPGLELPASTTIISKASQVDKDAYSGFEGTDLTRQLRELSVENIVICGLATDYCVKATALDGLAAGFAVEVMAAGIRGVEVEAGDSDKAIAEMAEKGAVVTAGIEG